MTQQNRHFTPEEKRNDRREMGLSWIRGSSKHGSSKARLLGFSTGSLTWIQKTWGEAKSRRTCCCNVMLVFGVLYVQLLHYFCWDKTR